MVATARVQTEADRLQIAVGSMELPAFCMGLLVYGARKHLLSPTLAGRWAEAAYWAANSMNALAEHLRSITAGEVADALWYRRLAEACAERGVTRLQAYEEILAEDNPGPSE